MDNAGLAPSEVPQQLHRERLLDMERRLARSRRVAFGVLAAGLIASGPWEGWWWLIPLAAAAVAFAVTDRFLERSDCPGRWAAAGWAVSPLMIAISVALTGAADSEAISWFALPAVTLAARFEIRGVAFGMAYIVGLMLMATVGVEPGKVADDPTVIFFPLALTVAAVILAWAVVESDRDHRRDAVLDPLTGLLNRSALAQRFDELERSRRAEDTGVMAMILADLDHFKSVNDTLGHAAGDAVLRDAAYAMRESLRSHDQVYRVGGEEFLVILPGAGPEQAEEAAERVRAAVLDCSRPDLEVSMSLGVAHGADPAKLFMQADVALYAAKRAGRNCVRTYAAAVEDQTAEPARL